MFIPPYVLHVFCVPSILLNRCFNIVNCQYEQSSIVLRAGSAPPLHHSHIHYINPTSILLLYHNKYPLRRKSISALFALSRYQHHSLSRARVHISSCTRVGTLGYLRPLRQILGTSRLRGRENLCVSLFLFSFICPRPREYTRKGPIWPPLLAQHTLHEPAPSNRRMLNSRK